MTIVPISRSGLRVHTRLVALAGCILVLPACAPPEPPKAAQCPPTPAAASSAPPPKAAETPPPPAAKPSYDVIIVGAGLAGLTAAKELRQANLNVVVIEATNRIGGRGITTETLGKGTFSVPVDLGGAWIHGVKTNPLTPLVVGEGFETQRTHVDAAENLFYKHHFANEKERKAFSGAYEAFETALEAAFEAGGDEGKPKGGDGKTISAAAFLNEKAVVKLDPVPRRLLELNAGPLEGATELSKSSLEDATDFISADDDFIKKGYGTFVEEFGADVVPFVRLGMPVTKITRTKGGVVVEAGQGETFEGKKVLVTVSTGVLARKKITFDPPLPASKVEAIEGLPMGLLDKVILEFSTPDVFPTHDGKSLKNTWVLYGGDDKDGRDDLAFVFKPMDTNIAVGFFGGSRAWDLEKEPDHGKATMVEIAVKAMTDMCKASRPKQDAGKCDAKAALKVAKTTAWGSESWTLGAYSAALPGMAKMREALAEPVDSVIYFAGEACYNATYNGSFAAAYSSALRAGEGMIDCLAREKRGEACVWRRMTQLPHQAKD